MQYEDLIIRVIQQDLKHNQLTAGLRRAGLQGDDIYYLGILELVSDLMEVPKGYNIEDRWTELYISFMDEAIHFKISDQSDSLRPLAEICYRQLKTLIEQNQKQKV